MLPIRTRSKKTLRKYPLRKKINGVKKTSNDKKNYSWADDFMQKKVSSFNIIPLFPSKA